MGRQVTSLVEAVVLSCSNSRLVLWTAAECDFRFAVVEVVAAQTAGRCTPRPSRPSQHANSYLPLGAHALIRLREDKGSRTLLRLLIDYALRYPRSC